MALTQRTGNRPTPMSDTSSSTNNKPRSRLSLLSSSLPSPKNIPQLDDWYSWFQVVKNGPTTKKEREALIVGFLLSGLVVWIFLLGGFNFVGVNKNTGSTISVSYKRQQLKAAQSPHGHILTVFDTKVQQTVASFAIEIVPQEVPTSTITKNKNATTNNSTPAVLSTAGPHTVRVSLLDRTVVGNTNSNNPQPPIVCLAGDVLIPIPLVTTNPSTTGSWTGTFTLPRIDGTLQLLSKWTGRECAANQGTYKNQSSCTMRHSKETTVEIRVGKFWEQQPDIYMTKSLEPSWQDSESLFPPRHKQAWIHASKIPNYPPIPPLRGYYLTDAPRQTYVYGDLTTMTTSKWTIGNTREMTDEPVTYIPLSSTVLPDHNQEWFESFNSLSNYEIVCFLGGKSANFLMATFMSLRADLFARQRPFKFHYHPMEHLETPDASWDDDLKEKFRKCKHVFVSLEDPSFMESASTTSIEGDPVSAIEFQQKVNTFTQHLLKAFPDPTFPIWMVLTHWQSPLEAQYQKHYCFDSTSKQQFTSLEHPCHAVLRKMFTKPGKADLFPAADQERIRLLDNTDVSAALVGNVGGHPRQLDVLGIIALRFYVLIGKQVKEWRDQKQIGLIDGLHRGDSLIPHPNGDHYMWNQ